MWSKHKWWCLAADEVDQILIKTSGHGQTVMSVFKNLSCANSRPSSKLCTRTGDIQRWPYADEACQYYKLFLTTTIHLTTWMLPKTCFLVSFSKRKHGFLVTLKRDCAVKLLCLCVCVCVCVCTQLCGCVQKNYWSVKDCALCALRVSPQLSQVNFSESE